MNLISDHVCPLGVLGPAAMHLVCANHRLSPAVQNVSEMKNYPCGQDPGRGFSLDMRFCFIIKPVFYLLGMRLILRYWHHVMRLKLIAWRKRRSWGFQSSCTD